MSKKVAKRLIDFEVMENKSSYEIVRNSYKNQENIPPSMINTILEHHFGSDIKYLHDFDNTIKIVAIKVLNLLKAPVHNWCQNRDPDMVRIPDIASYINKNRKPLQTVLYLSYKNKKDIFEIIDGIHRFSALKYIYETNMKNINNSNTDYISDDTYIDFYGDMSWLYNSYILVNINFNASIGELIELRNSLNMTQPMPTVLMDDDEAYGQEKKKILEEIATTWQQIYPNSFSPRAVCPTYLRKQGLTNRNNFIALLDIIYTKYNINNSRITLLKQVLEEANTNMKELIEEKKSVGTAQARVKCKETGCYLFIYNNEQLAEFI